jgi:dolichol-phosphate mannosyltransferase
MPIKVATKFGFGIAGLGFVSTMYVLFGFFSGKQPFNGFAALACGILILGGMQLAIIGIIGEYIYRTYDIARNRPHFAVEKVV